MSRVAWAKLMRLGLLELGLAPEIFWSLTPAELMVLVRIDNASVTMTRAGFQDLAAKFPDRPEARNHAEEEWQIISPITSALKHSLPDSS